MPDPTINIRSNPYRRKERGDKGKIRYCEVKARVTLLVVIFYPYLLVYIGNNVY